MGPGDGGIMNSNGEITRRKQWEELELYLGSYRRNSTDSGYQVRWKIDYMVVTPVRHGNLIVSILRGRQNW